LYAQADKPACKRKQTGSLHRFAFKNTSASNYLNQGLLKNSKKSQPSLRCGALHLKILVVMNLLPTFRHSVAIPIQKGAQSAT